MDRVCSSSVVYRSHDGRGTVAGSVAPGAFRSVTRDRSAHRQGAAGLGLLSGKYTRDTEFPEGDHRNHNRDGAAFDVGETFAGVNFATGVKAAQEFSGQVPDGVTTVIPEPFRGAG